MLPGVLVECPILWLERWMPLGVLLPEILEEIMGVAPGVLLVKIPGGMTMIPPGVLLLWTEVGSSLEIAPLEGCAAELLGELEVTVENEPEGWADDLGTDTELSGGTEDPVAVVLPVGLLQTLEGEAEAPGELDTLEDKIADDPVTELAETAEDGTELLAALDQADDPASGEVAGVEEPEAELAGGSAAKVPEDGAAWVPEDGLTGVPEGVGITIPEGGGVEIPEDGVAEFAGPEDAVWDGTTTLEPPWEDGWLFQVADEEGAGTHWEDATWELGWSLQTTEEGGAGACTEDSQGDDVAEDGGVGAGAEGSMWDEVIWYDDWLLRTTEEGFAGSCTDVMMLWDGTTTLETPGGTTLEATGGLLWAMEVLMWVPRTDDVIKIGSVGIPWGSLGSRGSSVVEVASMDGKLLA
jgi:hypothetical protein